MNFDKLKKIAWSMFLEFGGLSTCRLIRLKVVCIFLTDLGAKTLKYLTPFLHTWSKNSKIYHRP